MVLASQDGKVWELKEVEVTNKTQKKGCHRLCFCIVVFCIERPEIRCLTDSFQGSTYNVDIYS